jgi:uncharacterized protein (TIGR02145 family)
MNLSASCNSSTCSGQIQSKHKGICPEGWHIPSQTEWNVLSSFVGGSNTEGKHLKSQEGCWGSCGPSGSGRSYLCEDTYGFAALPGGYGNSDGSFRNVGSIGFWWSASEYSSGYAYGRYMDYYLEGAGWSSLNKSGLRSVRCLKD